MPTPEGGGEEEHVPKFQTQGVKEVCKPGQRTSDNLGCQTLVSDLQPITKALASTG